MTEVTSSVYAKHVTQRSMQNVETDGTEEKVIHMSRASADIKNIFVGAFLYEKNFVLGGGLYL